MELLFLGDIRSKELIWLAGNRAHLAPKIAAMGLVVGQSNLILDLWTIATQKAEKISIF